MTSNGSRYLGVDVDSIVSRHVRVAHREWGFDSDGDYSEYVGADRCALDKQKWPCDAIQLSEAILHRSVDERR